MTAFLWTHFVVGILALLANAFLISVGQTTTTKPSERGWMMLTSAGFLAWTAWLLFAQ